jgi:signal transduction histidine kinase
MTDLRRGGSEVDRSLPRDHALIRAVTHEIRSPLTVIRAYSSVALQPKAKLTAGKMLELLQGIESSVRLAEVIVDDLETLAAHAAIRLRPQTLDLATFLPSLAPDLQALAPTRELELVLREQPARLRADPMRLRQVLTNLVENAHKHSRPGGRITVLAGQTDRDTLLAVEDEGPGVPAEELNRIFEPFYRGSRSAGVKGSGLGLAICRGLVEAQGGQLEAMLVPRRFRMTMTFPAAA